MLTIIGLGSEIKYTLMFYKPILKLMKTNAMACTGCCQWGVQSDIHITKIEGGLALRGVLQTTRGVYF